MAAYLTFKTGDLSRLIFSNIGVYFRAFYNAGVSTFLKIGSLLSLKLIIFSKDGKSPPSYRHQSVLQFYRT
ncbi:MAG: hypothetical protein LBG21_05640 [Campylobacteraceae bacterium]|nr:hypothetical protein [Campylobacteraceae bacterium]